MSCLENPMNGLRFQEVEMITSKKASQVVSSTFNQQIQELLPLPCHPTSSFTGVEYSMTPEDYDGVSEWCCDTCGKRYGRWTGKELKDGELERRYGRS